MALKQNLLGKQAKDSSTLKGKRMANLYYDNSADLALIQGKKVAIIGYGSQGHAHALNLRDSGVSVRVGLQRGGASASKAQKEGLAVSPPAEAAAWADVIMILAPDTKQPKLYRDSIAPHLTAGKTLMFAHGFNIRFGAIKPPASVDVSMIAPKAPGHRVREVFVEGGGTPALLAVEQDASGEAKALALSYAKGLGCTRAGVLETTFTEETEKGCPNFLATRHREQTHPVEQLGPKLRAMMPFLQPIVAPGLATKAATSEK